MPLDGELLPPIVLSSSSSWTVHYYPEHVGQQLDDALQTHSKAAAPAPPPRAVDNPADTQTACQGANDPQRILPRKRKADETTPWGEWESSGSLAWEGWDEMYNHRKKLRYKLEVALEMYDSLTVESVPFEMYEACSNLERQYRKLHYLDTMDIIIRRCKLGGEEQHIYMSDQQIQKI